MQIVHSTGPTTTTWFSWVELNNLIFFSITFLHFLINQTEKRGTKFELETETKANSSPYLVRRIINFPKTPNPETTPNAHLKRENLTPPSPGKHSESQLFFSPWNKKTERKKENDKKQDPENKFKQCRKREKRGIESNPNAQLNMERKCNLRPKKRYCFSSIKRPPKPHQKEGKN